MRVKVEMTLNEVENNAFLALVFLCHHKRQRNSNQSHNDDNVKALSKLNIWSRLVNQT